MPSIIRYLSKVRQPLLSKTVCNVGFRGFASSDKLVDISINEETGVSTVTMQRSPVNGLNLELLTQLNETLDILEKNKSAGMILTSAMPTIFSAGLDIMEMYKPKPDRVKQFWTALQDTWLKLYGSSFPTVAAINGHSPAGGCLLALSCEYRVMVGPKYTIGLNETKLGILAPPWFVDTMRNTIGQRQAELALTAGRLFKADEALKVGLIDEIASDKADAVARAGAFIATMSGIPPLARALAKRSIRGDTLARLVEGKQRDLDTFFGLINMPDMQQGIERYLHMLKQKKQ